MPAQGKNKPWPDDTPTTSTNDTTTPASTRPTQTPDWDAAQYLKFSAFRNRAPRDLLAEVALTTPKRIVDLGCGPGNSTAVLAQRYPNSDLTGVDRSPDMLAQARRTLPNLTFEQADLESYEPLPNEGVVDLYFSSSVLHWLPGAGRVPFITRLLSRQSAGGCFAFQVPDVLDGECHTAPLDIARDPRWGGALDFDDHPFREPWPSSAELYAAFRPWCTTVSIWFTQYEVFYESHEDVVEFYKGSALRPFLAALDEAQQDQFLGLYLDRMRRAYPSLEGGGVLTKFPRMFVVLVRA